MKKMVIYFLSFILIITRLISPVQAVAMVFRSSDEAVGISSYYNNTSLSSNGSDVVQAVDAAAPADASERQLKPSTDGNMSLNDSVIPEIATPSPITTVPPFELTLPVTTVPPFELTLPIETPAQTTEASVLAGLPQAATPSGISTAWELYDQLREYDPADGILELSADLYWTRELPSTVSLTNAVEINTHGHTIHVTGNSSLKLQGPISFFGTAAVFRIEPDASLFMDSNVRIRTSGDGISAILSEGPSSLSSDGAEIYADGSGSAAIEAPAGLTISNIKLFASGDEAAAITGTAPIDLTYCDIRAEGRSAAAVKGPAAATENGVIFDTCYISPQAANAAVLNRIASIPNANSAYATSIGDESIPLPMFSWIILDEAEGRPGFRCSIPLKWSVPDNIDFSREGTYTLTARLTPRFPDIELSLPETMTFPLYIFDSALPRLFSAQQLEARLRLYPFRGKIRLDQNDILWCSADVGETFFEVQPLNRSDKYPVLSYITLEDVFERDIPYYFKLEQRNDDGTVAAVSNVLKVTLRSDYTVVSEADGDRDFGDRGEQNPPDDPPEDDSGDEPGGDKPDSGTSGGGSSSGSGGHGGASGGQAGAAGNQTPASNNENETVRNDGDTVQTPSDFFSSGSTAGETNESGSINTSNQTDQSNRNTSDSVQPQISSSALTTLKSYPANPPRGLTAGAGDLDAPNARTDFTYTGKQLANELEAHPFGITVVGKDVRLVLTSGAISGLNLDSASRFTVHLEKKASKTWYIAFSADDAEISLPFLLLVPGDPSAAASFSCRDESGVLYAADPSEPHGLSFLLPGTGTYLVFSGSETPAIDQDAAGTAAGKGYESGSLAVKLLLIAAGAASILLYLLSSKIMKGKK